MARLSAHGREVFRASKSWETPEDEITLRRESYRSVRSDGYVLAKQVAVFRPGKWDRHDPAAKPERWSAGWKVRARLKPEANNAAGHERLVAGYEKLGWTVDLNKEGKGGR